MNKQDRNTAITVLLVLVVSTLSLIIVGSYLLRLVIPIVEVFADFFVTRIRLEAVNYNFTVPEVIIVESAVPVPPPVVETVNPSSPQNQVVIPADYTYNFVVPNL